METSIYSYNLLDSINKLTAVNQSSDFENTLSYLTQRELEKDTELQKIIKKYIKNTIKSSNKLSEYRTRIQRIIADLCEVYESKIEIYNAQVDNNSQIILILQQWEFKKEKLINKINEINNNNEFGIKYNKLIMESNDNLDKISQLRLQLINLENKQSLLNNELLDTKNIIESKLFKFNESYNQIEEYQAFTLKKLNYQIPTIPSSSSSSSSQSQPQSEDDQNNNYYMPTSNISNKSKLKINPKFLVQELTPKVETKSIIESIALQNNAIKDLISNENNLLNNLKSFQIVINYTFELLTNMESDLFANIQDTSMTNKEPKMIKILKDTIDQLYSKFTELQTLFSSKKSTDNWSLIIDNILYIEIKTIEKSLSLLDSDYKSLELSPLMENLSISTTTTSLSQSQSQSQSQSPPTNLNPGSLSTSHTFKLKTPSPTPTLPKLSQTSAFASLSKSQPSPIPISNNTISTQLLGTSASSLSSPSQTTQDPVLQAPATNTNHSNTPTVTTTANITAHGISKPTSSFKKYIDVNNGFIKNKGSKKD